MTRPSQTVDKITDFRQLDESFDRALARVFYQKFAVSKGGALVALRRALNPPNGVFFC